MEIALSIGTDGSIEFTRNKNLDTFWGGVGRMKRVTDILKQEHGPYYYIQWLMGPFSRPLRKAHDLTFHKKVFGDDMVAWDAHVDDNTGTLLFLSYEAAVHYEILCLNKMRESGTVFDA